MIEFHTEPASKASNASDTAVGFSGTFRFIDSREYTYTCCIYIYYSLSPFLYVYVLRVLCKFSSYYAEVLSICGVGVYNFSKLQRDAGGLRFFFINFIYCYTTILKVDFVEVSFGATG